MSLEVAELEVIAAETRADFQNGIITPQRLVEVVRLHRPDIIRHEEFRKRFRPPHFDRDHGISEEDQAQIEASLLEAATGTLETFPGNACDHAVAELRDRIGYGRIVRSSYGTDDGGHYDENTDSWVEGYMDFGDRYHAFLDLGATSLSRNTIADITADQFGGPAIYVGPLIPPWSRSGNYRVV